MISYQWDVQSSMIQLKNRLQADGYKVWMDIDQMGGSTLESMAKAVEDATVVLIGVSQKYKESPNCRSGTQFLIFCTIVFNTGGQVFVHIIFVAFSMVHTWPPNARYAPMLIMFFTRK